ncbi:patatin-like phospholipase family protein [Methylobacterium sp. 37f]|uniref:patatin-like phospholipase family protein n=1 Tax=Methylobacterium sp. 37f TaxID=2817058 RepID=UPI001FFC3DC5|nr:patatin-like phospholipase family protein [Methylobacterium sp. 37f]MCK2055654.1 patatin-like phospholipase family protein [Methylobacterium sp. 37f]
MSGSSISRTGLRHPALLWATVIGLSLPQTAFAGERAKPHVDRASAENQVRSEKQSGRVIFTAAEAATARPDGLSADIRLPGDDAGAFRALIDQASAADRPWLVLSGGGENGAFAAGLLNGWSEVGTRPDFGVITGVSTGAMIAPFAFIGARGDAALRENYTEISAADVFEFGGTNEALTDTWPLKRRIDRAVTPALLEAVAAEHAKGRRLLVATTAVDGERPVLWDMGAIAKAGGPKALALFRSVILASSAVPGVFPPVMIDAVAGSGKRFQEMHADGGTTAPYYLAPESVLQAKDPTPLPTRQVYLVVNNTLTPDFQMASRTTLSVLGRSMSAAIKAQTRAALALSEGFARRTGLDLQVAQIDGRFGKTSSAPFDQGYMKALFAQGVALGKAGTAFQDGRTDPAEIATGSVERRATQDAPVRSVAGR